MATTRIPLPLAAATFPDGSTNNIPPGQSLRKGSQTGTAAFIRTIDFDGAGAVENIFWTLRLPDDYVSGGTLKLHWMANATSGNVKWQARVGAVTPADADTALEHAFAAAATVTTAANATEARRVVESSITLTTDSMAPGDLVTVHLFRDSGDAADTCTVDAELLSAQLEYTS